MVNTQHINTLILNSILSSLSAGIPWDVESSICEHKDNQELQNTARKSLFQEMITGYSRE